MEKIYIGAAYYPELWDSGEVEKDIERCKSLGINTLRVAEFAWEKMQPSEGEYRLDWLKEIVDKLYEAGIYTVMCTPTATPPRWLLNKYPETRMMMHDLIRADVSSRCHTCKTSPVLREKNRGIVTALAEMFGGHPGVIGWQIDNEIFPYSGGCYCENCQRAFRKYLKKIYGDIQNLNKSWGMLRWSLGYGDFEEIQPPYPKQWRHPSLRKAWWDFQCEQIRTYVNEQAEILHRFTKAPVGTDMMENNNLSYYKITEKLDVIQYNHYERANRLPQTVFSYDFLRPIKNRPFWIMETQTNWNGSEYAENGWRPMGNCYVNTWSAVAHGAEMNLYWLFRTHLNGHELAHGALYSSSGRAYKVAEEVRRAANDIEKCADLLHNTKVCSKIALHYSSTATNNFEVAPIIKDFNYRESVLENFYAAFRHYNIDVIDTPHSLDEYEVVISPFLSTVDENGLKERIAEWVEQGGVWIVGPMSGMLDENVCKYSDSPYPFIESLGGVYTKYQKPINSDFVKAEWNDGTVCPVSVCFDAFELRENTKSLAHYVDEEFSPYSVVTERKVGKGKVIVLGSVLSHADLLRLVGRAPIAEASKNIELIEREGKEDCLIVLETEHEPGFISLEGRYTDVIGNRIISGRTEVRPYEVLVLKKYNGQ